MCRPSMRACVHVSPHSAGAWRSRAWCMMIIRTGSLIDAVSLSQCRWPIESTVICLIWSTILIVARVKFTSTRLSFFLVSILQTAHLWANTGVVFRELSFSRLECGVHDRLHIYPMCGIFYFPWHRHQIEGTNGFYCLIRKTERFTISNVESQVFTPNNSRLDPGSNPGCPRDKRMSYHWTNCASLKPPLKHPRAFLI